MGAKVHEELGGCTQQEDNLARLYVLYGRGTQAYREAYNCKDATTESAYVMASRTLALSQVQARITHYRKIAAKQWEASIERIAEQLGMAAFADKRDMYDDAGNVLPPNKWPEHIARTITGIEVLEHRDDAGEITGRTRKIQFESRSAALATLAKWRGMLIDRVETGAPGEFDQKSDEELLREIAEARADLKALSGGRKAPAAASKAKVAKKPPAKKS